MNDGREPPRDSALAGVRWWRWLPWLAPRLRLGPNVRPQTRLELALCARFRCQREWPARELVERLAHAPAGSDDNLALVARDGVGASSRLGRGAVWAALQEWLERGTVHEVRDVRRAPLPDRAIAAAGPVGQAEPRSWPARSTGEANAS